MGPLSGVTDEAGKDEVPSWEDFQETSEAVLSLEVVLALDTLSGPVSSLVVLSGRLCIVLEVVPTHVDLTDGPSVSVFCDAAS